MILWRYCISFKYRGLLVCSHALRVIQGRKVSARSRGEALSDLKVSMIAKQCVLVEILYAVPHILERGRENLKHVTRGGSRILVLSIL
jgi:hypothetical protein